MTAVILAFAAGLIAGVLFVVFLLRMAMSEDAIGCVILFGAVVITLFMGLVMTTQTLIDTWLF